jgi:glyoxylase-like metal-dependent hydrolase (beta-lactamase superfamily II)
MPVRFLVLSARLGCPQEAAFVRKTSNKVIAGLLALAWIGIGVSASAQQQAKRSISNIKGDLYRFQNNFHYSVFLVTSEGIIATDPIDADAARWLKAELKKRFDKPVKYLIYSHDHRDHSSGGEVFADTATVIAHDKAKATILGEKRPTAVPNITFSDRLTIELGGKVVELIYVGRSHSDNLIAVHFPAERAVYAVDFITVKSLPYMNLSDSYFPDWINAIKVVEAVDFDILIPGHGAVGVKADASDHRAYMQDLYDAVLAAARAGRSLDEMKQSIKLERYKDWAHYAEWRPLNIEGVYQRISLQRRGN